MSIEDREGGQPTGALAELPSNANNELASCGACSEQFPANKLVKVRCGHEYCGGCLKKFFEEAMKDEAMYPPRCCQIKIPLILAQKELPKDTIRRFNRKSLELATRNRTYCYKAFCSAFIAPHSIHNGQAICQKCGAVTCSKCKDAWHYGPCSEGEDAAFFDFIRSTRWKKCPECRRIVEKSNGCNHIVFVAPSLHYSASLTVI